MSLSGSAAPRPSVTLLMPNRNNEPVLDLTLSRLAENTTYPNYELIVVDDGSTDGSLDILLRWRASKRITDFAVIEHQHRGVVEALNAGLQAATGDLVVQLDGDATLETPGWLERMVDFHAVDPLVGVVCPLVLYDDGNVNAAGVNVIDPLGLHDRGSVPNETAGSRSMHTNADRFPPTDIDHLVEEPAEVDCAIGVCMLYARALAEEIGGYDPGFAPVWFDDLDLALSARRLGRKVFYTPNVEVIHRSTRNPRESPSPARAVGRGLRSALAPLTPSVVRRAVRRAEGRDSGYSPEQLKRLRHHFAYWRQKWGFDLLNPDMNAVLERYGSTEVTWAYDDERRAAGEAIIARAASTSS